MAGMFLLTIIVLADLIQTVIGVAHGFVPAMALLRSVIYTFASGTATAFLLAFYERE